MSLELLKYCKEHLKYNRAQGTLHWKKSPCKIKKNMVGTNAGHLPKTTKNDRYIRVKLMGKKYLAHRIIWLMEYGAFPKDCLDHINGDRYDNRIKNLREVTHGHNMRNTKIHREGRIPGVFKRQTTWYIRFTQYKKQYYKSGFKTEAEAILAHKELSR